MGRAIFSTWISIFNSAPASLRGPCKGRLNLATVSIQARYRDRNRNKLMAVECSAASMAAASLGWADPNPTISRMQTYVKRPQFALECFIYYSLFRPRPGVLPPLPESAVQICHMLGASALRLRNTRQHTSILSSCSILGGFGVEGRPLEEGLGRERRRRFGCCTFSKPASQPRWLLARG